MDPNRFEVKQQAGRGISPWPLRARIGMLLFWAAWAMLCRPTPKFFYPWRLLVLRVFGCKVTGGRPFVASSARVRIPWLLTLESGTAIGEEVDVYNLAPITLRRGCTVAQQVYLCAGSHDLDDPNLPLMVAPIVVGEEVFIGVRALVLPGVVIGDRAVVGAGAVVTKDVPAGMIVGGNPAKVIRPRDSGTPA